MPIPVNYLVSLCFPILPDRDAPGIDVLALPMGDVSVGINRCDSYSPTPFSAAEADSTTQ
jgi:hypothetical protein